MPFDVRRTDHEHPPHLDPIDGVTVAEAIDASRVFGTGDTAVRALGNVSGAGRRRLSKT